MSKPLLEVEGTPEIGKIYHVSWASNAVKGKCMSIDPNTRTVILMRPKTKTYFKYPVRWEELRHLRKEENKILKQ